MALTKSQFRDRVRELLGDPLRISGTATGGSLTTIIDSSKLMQADNHWLGLNAFVVTTTDSNAPKGDARRIAASSASAYRLTTEMPFSAAVEAGDTYGVAVFSNARLDNIISNTLGDFSNYRPLKFNESLSVGGGEKRYSPTSAATILFVTKVEEYNASQRKDVLYKNWVWNPNTKKIEFSDWITTAKTLTIYAAKSHVLPATDGDAMTYNTEDEADLLVWCSANALLNLAEQQSFSDYGKLKPKSITRGAVSETYGNAQEIVMKSCNDRIAEIKSKYHADSSSWSSEVRVLPALNPYNIDRSTIWLNH